MPTYGRTCLERVPATRPSPQQAAWQDLEYGMFCHFGLYTFTGTITGSLWFKAGVNPAYSPSLETVDPGVFNPTDLDANQWVAAAKSAGMKYLVLTAKHHDGFCLWPPATTEYSVKHSPWRGGKGDVVREVAEACHAQGIGFGIYLSPWDAYAYSVLKLDDAAYDEYYKQQLTELLTNYGEVMEGWWDGAGATMRKHDWEGYYRLVKSLQPNVLTTIMGSPSDIRVGNETGIAPDPLWNVVEVSGKDYWQPAEAPTCIRDQHWGWRPDDQDTLRSLDNLLDVYYRSVGHGANLLLNIAPNNRGLLPAADVKRVQEVGEIISKTYANNLLRGHRITASSICKDGERYEPAMAIDGDLDTWWQAEDRITEAWLEVDMGKPVTFNRAVMQEAIVLGQRIRAYQLLWWDGNGWQQASAGTSIGHKKIGLFPEITASKVRLDITAATLSPTIREFGLYYAQPRG